MPTLVRLDPGVSNSDYREVYGLLASAGVAPRVHNERTLSVKGDGPWLIDAVASHSSVAEVVHLDADLPLTAATEKRDATEVSVGQARFGPGRFQVVAGPCSVETEGQMLDTAQTVRAAGAGMLRGGLYKPRTSPYSFHGLGREGYEIALAAKELTGLPFVTEVLDPRDIDSLLEVADVLQIGARNMQNFALLREVGISGHPVLLKRGMSATVEDLLLAAEYVLDAGGSDVILCERGIRTFESSYRFTLDLGAVPVLREKTHLPVIVDPSHAAGATRWVQPLSLAAAAVGADGVIIETHRDPSAAWCDAAQALPAGDLPGLMDKLRIAASAAGRSLPSASLLPAAAAIKCPA